MIRLVIEKMSKGGFVVYDGDGLGQGGLVAAIHAATDIADALAFIGDNLAPVEKAFPPDCSAIKGAPCPDKGQCAECLPKAYCTMRGAAHCSEYAPDVRCTGCPHRPLSGETPPDPGCSVCGSLHSDGYCARLDCSRQRRNPETLGALHETRQFRVASGIGRDSRESTGNPFSRKANDDEQIWNW